MKNLVKLIKKYPNAVFTVDNDCWWMHKNQKSKDDGDSDIASNGEVIDIGDGGYGSGCSYGGDILQALAVIVGVKIESV